jgi:hypothetical protein
MSVFESATVKQLREAVALTPAKKDALASKKLKSEVTSWLDDHYGELNAKSLMQLCEVLGIGNGKKKKVELMEVLGDATENGLNPDDTSTGLNLMKDDASTGGVMKCNHIVVSHGVFWLLLKICYF